MANILNIVVLPTYDINTLAVADASIYDDSPPIVVTPTLEIEVPGFGPVFKTFVVQTTNIYNSTDLGITIAGHEEPLPDGIYCLTYSIYPPQENYIEKSFLRVDRLQEKFDEAFMKLDMMECDRAIKTQAKVDLFTIYFFIQGAIASANNCAIIESTKLYTRASSMLNSFIGNNCGCSGTNYITNFS